MTVYLSWCAHLDQHHGRRKGSYIYGKREKKEEEEGPKERNEEIKEGSNDGGGMVWFWGLNSFLYDHFTFTAFWFFQFVIKKFLKLIICDKPVNQNILL